MTTFQVMTGDNWSNVLYDGNFLNLKNFQFSGFFLTYPLFSYAS